MKHTTKDDSDTTQEKQTEHRRQVKSRNFYRAMVARILGTPTGIVHKGRGHGGNTTHGFRRGTYGKIRRVMKRTARMF